LMTSAPGLLVQAVPNAQSAAKSRGQDSFLISRVMCLSLRVVLRGSSTKAITKHRARARSAGIGRLRQLLLVARGHLRLRHRRDVWPVICVGATCGRPHADRVVALQVQRRNGCLHLKCKGHRLAREILRIARSRERGTDPALPRSRTHATRDLHPDRDRPML
jgi:hypothetical protein